ncbi:MAG: hypothetical protein H6510_09340 [Acidobacteria bacterium]|nr:hypothetical protein [Acidobacteriota bacterium]MCB9398008.1 hypothetical protein [Acidobacteriota bacterium]
MTQTPYQQIQDLLPDELFPELDPPAHGLAGLRLRLHPAKESAPFSWFWVLAMVAIVLVWAFGIQFARPKAQLTFSAADRVVLGLDPASNEKPASNQGQLQVGPNYIMIVSLQAEPTPTSP